MFHVNLGNVSYMDADGNRRQVGWDDFNSIFIDERTGDLVSFINIDRFAYWQDINLGADPNDKSMFNMAYGIQYGTTFCCANWSYHGWALRDGDVAAVPEPVTLAIFTLGLIGLGLRRFKKRS